MLVSLLLNQLCPDVGGISKSMESVFLLQGVCGILILLKAFGNGGDPYLSENDAGLDIEHWTGHTGCVIVAPHLAGTPKQILNLPSKSGYRREIRDGMYYEGRDELYNDGGAFKLALEIHWLVLPFS